MRILIRARAEMARLTVPKVLGFYSHFEATELFAIRDGERAPLNVFSILVAEERAGAKVDKPVYLGGRIRLNSLQGWTFGIQQCIRPISQLEQAFEHFRQTGEWRPSDDYFEHWFDREPAAAGWREELESMAIDKKSLDRGLQTRGFRAVTLVEYARRKKLYDPIAHVLASTLNYEKSYFDKLVASLLPLMEKLTTGRTASLLSPVYDDLDDWRPVFDWTSVINLGGIVYVGLDALSDYEVAAAVGARLWKDEPRRARSRGIGIGRG